MNIWALVLILIHVPAFAQQLVDQRALLSLSVNQDDKNETLVIIRGTDVLIGVATLEAAGVRVFAGRRESIDTRLFVSLASLGPAIRFSLDVEALSLSITADLPHLGAVVLDLWPTRPALEYARTTSAFLNYGVNWNRVGGVYGSLEAGLSIGPALAQNTVSWDRRGGFVRGVSNVVFDDRKWMRRWTLGDSLVGATVLGSGLLVGGVHVSREYSLDPYFIQFPTLRLSGTTLTPSMVEIYVNDHLVSREQVAPGSFNLTNVPMPSGSSDTRVVVRDAFGREQQILTPFYLTTTALAKGLQDYDYAVGYPRAGGTSANWNYGRLSALTRHRYGLSDRLTAGLAAEADSKTLVAGPTANIRLKAGEIDVAVSGSRAGGTNGAALAAGYLFLGRPITFSLRGRAMTSGYSTLTLRQPEDRVRVEGSGSIGAQLGPWVAVSLEHAFGKVYSGEFREQASVFATVAVGSRVNVLLTASRVRSAGHVGTNLYAGVSIPMAARTSSGVSAHTGTNGSGVSADIQRSVPPGTGYGYRAQAALGNASQIDATVEAQGPFGHYAAGFGLLNGGQSPRASVTGGLVMIGGGVYPARSVTDSFALVRVPSVSGVRTYLNNQEVGRTNRQGDVLISHLLPNYANRIAISDQDVPIDRSVETVERSIAPPFRGGSLVLFRADQRQRLEGRVTVGIGGQTIVPALGKMTVSVGSESLSSPIGHNGEFYFENLPAGRHQAVVLFGEITCQFELSVPAAAGPTLQLGVVRCVVPEVKQP